MTVNRRDNVISQQDLTRNCEHMMSFRNLVWKNVPVPMRELMRGLHYMVYGRALRNELATLAIASSGQGDIQGQKAPYLVLQEGVTLFWRSPTAGERMLYRWWRHSLPDGLRLPQFRTAIDVVLRYKYPHAMPHLSVPYPLRARKCFHPQHRNCIWNSRGVLIGG